MVEGQSSSLKILCLHGWNENKQVMEFNTQSFKKVFGDQLEFTFLDAPFNTKDVPSEEMKKFLPADEKTFRSWLKYSDWDMKQSKAPPLVYGIEEAV